MDDKLYEALMQTWPARAAKGLWEGLMLPGDVYQGNISMYGPDGHTNPQVINRAADLAGAVTLGAGAIPAEANALRAGLPGRKLPTNNYTGPVSRYTDALYREMSPTEALADLPTSVMNQSQGMGGVRKFYADQPDLALGQGGNKGVRVEYDSTPFEGQINQSKPAWDLAFQQGNAEYIAAPQVGANIRDSVRNFEFDPSVLSRVEKAQYDRVLSNLESQGWKIERTPEKITAKKS